MKKNMKPLKFIDLFAGIGGLRTPFDELGCKSVFSSEWDKFAQQTYEANYGEIPAGDITDVKVTDVPAHDILLAGFPCQPFSMAGKKKGFDDARGTLFWNIAEILRFHRPRAFLLENVKNLRGHNKGQTFRVIKRILEEELRYDVHVEVLNAKDFGVPQNRQRIFIIGFRKPTAFSFPKPSGKKTRLGDILESRVDPKYTISDRLWAGHQRRKKEHRAKGNGFGYSLFNRNSEYTSTISARYYKDGSEILIEQRNKNPRRLTPREAARLQGFDDDFIIPVSDGQAYKQFGNAVAVPLIRAIAKQMLFALESGRLSDVKSGKRPNVVQKRKNVKRKKHALA